MNTTASMDRSGIFDSAPTVAEETKRRPRMFLAMLATSLVLIGLASWHSFYSLFQTWNSPDSLYSHALLIPPISLFFVWRLRKQWLAAPMAPAPWLGYPVLLGGCGMLLLGDFLGFMTFIHLSLLPILAGVCLLFLGHAAMRILWFPLCFLFFMVPMPYSILSVISFESKMLATESAVILGQAMTLNMVQDGSYIYLGADDRLLVGDVCGGMRSLIALLAFGALMAYISKTRWWARILILLLSPVVAIAANVTRILFLCIVGYVWGSEAATGLVHDASGIGIFAIAFVLLFSAEALLRKLAPAHEEEPVEP